MAKSVCVPARRSTSSNATGATTFDSLPRGVVEITYENKTNGKVQKFGC